MPWDWIAVAVIVVAGPVRVALRLYAQMRAAQRARQLGQVKCASCGEVGPFYGYATFFARQQIRCGRCKRPAPRVTARARTE